MCPLPTGWLVTPPPPPPSPGVEVGVHMGVFSYHILSIWKGRVLHLVDPWLAGEG